MTGTLAAGTTYDVPAGVAQHYVTGLDPAGAYDVTAVQTPAGVTVTVAANAAGTFQPDGGGVLAFTTNGGNVQPATGGDETFFTDVDLATIGLHPGGSGGHAGSGGGSGSGSDGGSDGSGDSGGGSLPVAGTATLASLVIPGLDPAFSPDVRDYTIPQPVGGSVPVIAVPANAAHALHIQSTPLTSGQLWNAWVGEGNDIDIVLYQNWTEVGRYTLTWGRTSLEGLDELPAAKAAASFVPPRTPWGHPDLQGVWANNMATPLERQFSTIEGLDSMTSVNSLGTSVVTLQFASRHLRVRRVFSEIRRVLKEQWLAAQASEHKLEVM